MAMSSSKRAAILAGIPAINSAFYWRIRFRVGDPAAFIEFPGKRGSILILRDIEIDRARRQARAGRVACPADFAPPGGLSGDRETATAQAAAECLRRAGVRRVTADRSLPLLFAEMIRRAGIRVECDPEMGVLERRRKDSWEIGRLREAQRITEGAVRMACEQVAGAKARRDGVLVRGGAPLTSERVRAEIAHWLMDRGYACPPAIVAGGPRGGDCHDPGSGLLRTGEPVIVDVFPRDLESGYCGDCTRTVVHGAVPPGIARMHAAVREAKAAAVAALRAGVTGEAVHAETCRVIREHGFSVGLPGKGSPPSYCALTHGTGHGVGLDVHEPPLLDARGPALVAGDAVTVEPGLYRRDLGGVRVEDLLVVTRKGCVNLGHLPEGLSWR
jgi:Xaa-Pro aminopeptidase